MRSCRLFRSMGYRTWYRYMHMYTPARFPIFIPELFISFSFFFFPSPQIPFPLKPHRRPSLPLFLTPV